MFTRYPITTLFIASLLHGTFSLKNGFGPFLPYRNFPHHALKYIHPLPFLLPCIRSEIDDLAIPKPYSETLFKIHIPLRFLIMKPALSTLTASLGRGSLN